MPLRELSGSTTARETCDVMRSCHPRTISSQFIDCESSHSTLFVKCDLLFLRSDEFSQNAFKRRQAVQIENHNIFFISLEDLV